MGGANCMDRSILIFSQFTALCLVVSVGTILVAITDLLHEHTLRRVLTSVVLRADYGF